MTLTGILKNILLVIISVMIWHTAITWMQFLGYSIACAGLMYYSLGWEQSVAIYQGISAYTRNLVRGGDSPDESARRLPSAVRRALITSLIMVVVIFLVVQFLYADTAPIVPVSSR